MLTNCKLVHQPHDHRRCIHAAMARANDICSAENHRLTPTRESVLRLLWQSHRPLGAYQLQDQLAKLSGKPIAPPTIYRAVDFLLKVGLIHRIASLNAYIGCPFPNSEHSNLFMICTGCGSAAELALNSVNELLKSTCDKANFTLDEQSIELYGLCPNCSIQEPGAGTESLADKDYE